MQIVERALLTLINDWKSALSAVLNRPRTVSFAKGWKRRGEPARMSPASAQVSAKAVGKDQSPEMGRSAFEPVEKNSPVGRPAGAPAEGETRSGDRMGEGPGSNRGIAFGPADAARQAGERGEQGAAEQDQTDEGGDRVAGSAKTIIPPVGRAEGISPASWRCESGDSSSGRNDRSADAVAVAAEDATRRYKEIMDLRSGGER